MTVPGIITTAAGMVTVVRGIFATRPRIPPATPMSNAAQNAARKDRTPAASRARRAALETIPSDAAVNAMRGEELNSSAKQPTLTKLASAPVTKKSVDLGTAAGVASGVPESIATVETVSMITTMISSAKNSRGMPAVKSNRVRSTNEVNSGKPGIRNSTAATNPGVTTPATGSARASRRNADAAMNAVAIVAPMRLKCARCSAVRTSCPSIAATHTSTAVA